MNADELGSGCPFSAADAAVDAVFCWVGRLYRGSGLIPEQLIGLQFRAGRAIQAHIEIVRSPERVATLIERMRSRWPAVAHVQLAERGPAYLPSLPKAGQSAVVVIDIHFDRLVVTARCGIDQDARVLTRGTVTTTDADRSVQP